MTSVSTIDYDRLFLLLTMTSVSTIHLLSGNEGNSKFIITRDPTIDRGAAERKSWCESDNKLAIPRGSSQ